ncbi:MAG: hypothetical protein IKE69_01800 [Thermoguttaceae bacterium]|nr:hypothetical protein [Thermoguttaceae bacterium]
MLNPHARKLTCYNLNIISHDNRHFGYVHLVQCEFSDDTIASIGRRFYNLISGRKGTTDHILNWMASQARFFESHYGGIVLYLKIKADVWKEQDSFIKRHFINDADNAVSISLILQFLHHQPTTELDNAMRFVFETLLEKLFPKLWKAYQPVVQSVTLSPNEQDQFLSYLACTFFEWAEGNGIDQIKGIPIKTLLTEVQSTVSMTDEQQEKFRSLVPTLTVKEIE